MQIKIHDRYSDRNLMFTAEELVDWITNVTEIHKFEITEVRGK